MQDGAIHIEESHFKSLLSFRPLVNALKKNIAEGNAGMQKLYGAVVEAFESHPELLEPIDSLDILQPHAELILELLSAVFPPTTSNFMYGVSWPFKFEAVYASPQFKKILIEPGTNHIKVPSCTIGTNLNTERLHFMYGLILKKYMGYTNSPDNSRIIYSYTDEETGLNRYMEMRLDGRFIDVKPEGELPKFPESILDPHTNRIFTIAELMEMVPLDKFIFEGLTVLRVNDITDQAVITEVKNKLLDANTFSDASVYTELETHIQELIGLKDLSIGITPFFRINGHYVYSELHNINSILFRKLHHSSDKDEICDYCKIAFRDNSQPVLYETLDDKTLNDYQHLQYYYMEGARSLIVCPMKQHGELIGLLEISAPRAGMLKPVHIGKIEAAIPLFTLGMEKSLEKLNSMVDAVIKRKFTAVQPAVEWRFTEAALNYIVGKQKHGDFNIERIRFPDVYPLYGAIDIRNSSTERSHSIQLDMIEQLELAKKAVVRARQNATFPLLEEIEYKINKHIEAASDVLLSDEEQQIREFLLNQVAPFFHHLLGTDPGLKNEIEHYFSSLDPQTGMLYKHRKAYEQSISRINDALAHFIDKEQTAAQKVYPHFFERYVTDGVEFNIYIGQSIAPRKRFDEIYLRNMRMWQLTMMTKASRLAQQMECELSHCMRTTQLILCYSEPLTISFRTEERKFDVDGAYNVRYEIVKKRIDKVHIRDTNERLTQPGKLAIVYVQQRDADEYKEYIEFLQDHGLLKPGIEYLDLEELQGVVGLKALRAEINFEPLKRGAGKTS